MDLKWYIVYTKPGSEKKVSDILTRKKIESYSPVNTIARKWNDNIKVKDTPIFRSYVFVKTTELYHPELKKINGVVNFVYWMGKPVCIKSVEIKAIKIFLNEYPNVTIEKMAIKSDYIDTAEISNKEQEAPMITIKNKKAYIGLPSLGYILSAEVETANVRIISSEGVLDTENLKPNKLFNKVSEFNNSLKNYWAKALIIAVFVSLLAS